MRPSPPPVTSEEALRGPGWVEDSSQAGLETWSCPIAVFQVLWEPVWGEEGQGAGLEVRGHTLVVVPEVCGEGDEIAAGPGARQGH